MNKNEIRTKLKELQDEKLNLQSSIAKEIQKQQNIKVFRNLSISMKISLEKTSQSYHIEEEKYKKEIDSLINDKKEQKLDIENNSQMKTAIKSLENFKARNIEVKKIYDDLLAKNEFFNQQNNLLDTHIEHYQELIFILSSLNQKINSNSNIGRVLNYIEDLNSQILSLTNPERMLKYEQKLFEQQANDLNILKAQQSSLKDSLSLNSTIQTLESELTQLHSRCDRIVLDTKQFEKQALKLDEEKKDAQKQHLTQRGILLKTISSINEEIMQLQFEIEKIKIMNHHKITKYNEVINNLKDEINSKNDAFFKIQDLDPQLQIITKDLTQANFSLGMTKEDLKVLRKKEEQLKEEIERRDIIKSEISKLFQPCSSGMDSLRFLYEKACLENKELQKLINDINSQ